MTDVKKPLVLLVLDGFGHSDGDKYNAIKAAKVGTRLLPAPYHVIATSGMAEGLPEGQMGNSEVGHMTLGAGRVVYQNYTRINKSISDGDFFTNPVYVEAVDKAIAADKAVHILGLLSAGGVHSHDDHIKAAIDLAAQRGAKQVYVHAFLDGRDVPPRSAEQPLQETEAKLRELGIGRIASISGRFFSLDRDNRWDRVQQAYDLMTEAKADFTPTPWLAWPPPTSATRTTNL